MAVIVSPPRRLDLSGNPSLTCLSESSEFLALSAAERAEITALELKFCKSLTSLQGIDQFTALAELNLSGCVSLSSLQGIECITSLSSLVSTGCSSRFQALNVAGSRESSAPGIYDGGDRYLDSIVGKGALPALLRGQSAAH